MATINNNFDEKNKQSRRSTARTGENVFVDFGRKWSSGINPSLHAKYRITLKHQRSTILTEVVLSYRRLKIEVFHLLETQYEVSCHGYSAFIAEFLGVQVTMEFQASSSFRHCACFFRQIHIHEKTITRTLFENFYMHYFLTADQNFSKNSRSLNFSRLFHQLELKFSRLTSSALNETSINFKNLRTDYSRFPFHFRTCIVVIVTTIVRALFWRCIACYVIDSSWYVIFLIRLRIHFLVTISITRRFIFTTRWLLCITHPKTPTKKVIIFLVQKCFIVGMPKVYEQAYFRMTLSLWQCICHRNKKTLK